MQDLLLLPGLLLDQRLWHHQQDALSTRARIAVPDLTGQDSMEALAESVLASAPERFALAGLSMGGYVALEILRQAPERVERFALLDSNAWQDSPAIRSKRRGYLELAEKGAFKGVTESLLPELLHPNNLAKPEIATLVMAMATAIGREGYKRQQTAILKRPDYGALLSKIRVPTLVLCGREDRLTPVRRHREMAVAIPDAHLVIVEGAGHLPPLERPSETTTALEQWLDRTF